MTRAMIEPIRFGSKNPSKQEQKQVEKAISQAWKERNLAKDIKLANLDIVTKELSKDEIEKICGF